MVLKIGTDCSGIEAPIQALMQLKINFTHIFSSEIDKYCIQSIKANYNPNIIFGDDKGDFPDGDITNRDLKDIPYVDIYVCGFPCQPFSAIGNQNGFKDKRSNVFFECMNIIEYINPKIFILENVKGITSNNKGKTWEIITNELKYLKKNYNIYINILNTKDYGLPQNRERLFIIGINKSFQKKDFMIPVKKKIKDVKNFIDNADNTKNQITNTIAHTLSIIPKNAVFVDYGNPSSTYPNSYLWCPTLTTTNNLWCVPKKRKANYKERLQLQGFPKNFKKVVSDTQIHKQIGNSMSVNIIKLLLKECLNCIGYF